MWPVHCVQESDGAKFHMDLVIKETDLIIRKATTQWNESYSGFGNSLQPTELKDKLTEAGITKVLCCGLAFDYCVGSTAIDAAKHGFQTSILTDASKSVALNSETSMKDRLKEAKVSLITCEEC